MKPLAPLPVRTSNDRRSSFLKRSLARVDDHRPPDALCACLGMPLPGPWRQGGGLARGHVRRSGCGQSGGPSLFGDGADVAWDPARRSRLHLPFGWEYGPCGSHLAVVGLGGSSSLFHRRAAEARALRTPSRRTFTRWRACWRSGDSPAGPRRLLAGDLPGLAHPVCATVGWLGPGAVRPV